MPVRLSSTTLDFRDAKNLLGQVLISEKKYQRGDHRPRAADQGPGVRPSLPRVGEPRLGAASRWASRRRDRLARRTPSPSRASASVTTGSGSASTARVTPGRRSESFTKRSIGRRPAVHRRCRTHGKRAACAVKLGKATEARSDYERCVEISKETQTGKICSSERDGRLASPASNRGQGPHRTAPSPDPRFRRAVGARPRLATLLEDKPKRMTRKT